MSFAIFSYKMACDKDFLFLSIVFACFSFMWQMKTTLITRFLLRYVCCIRLMSQLTCTKQNIDI